MNNFTPLSAISGGALIGLSAVLLMKFNGQIAGVSGIFSSALFGKSGDKLWRVLFILGLILGPVLYRSVTGMQSEFEITSNWILIVSGGLLVGFGTRLGSGCTSGHGVCGMARFSIRSVFAVVVFTAAGIATVTVFRAVSGV